MLGRATLPPGRWYPANHRALTHFLTASQVAPAAAVFDWDNTCIFNDIGDATFRYQCDQLEIRLTPEQVAALLPEEVNNRTHVGGVAIRALAADINAAYAALWPDLMAGRVAAVRHGAAHLDFRAKVGFLYAGLEQTEGIGPTFAYPWLVGWLGGFRREEIQALAVAAYRSAELCGAPSQIRWQCVSAGEAGAVSCLFSTYLTAHDEMLELMLHLRDQHFEIFVVTASAEAVVQGLAAHLKFPVAAAHVFGIRPCVEGGVFTTRTTPVDVYPLTYRRGKVEVIRRFLPAAPRLVAGDANTDFEMLTAFPETNLRLVVNRNLQGEIRSLYAAARREPAADPHSPVTLLQGRNENTGQFCPSQETIALGETGPRHLTTT